MNKHIQLFILTGWLAPVGAALMYFARWIREIVVPTLKGGNFEQLYDLHGGVPYLDSTLIFSVIAFCWLGLVLLHLARRHLNSPAILVPGFIVLLSHLCPAADDERKGPALHKDVIINGDFSEAVTSGLPTGWQPKGADYQGANVPWRSDAEVVQEGSEKFLRFRRTASVRLSNVGPKATIPIPRRAKAAVVSVRLRVKNLIPGNNYDRYPGVSIKAMDAEGKSTGPATAAATENTRWRTFTATLTLQPGAKTLDVSLGPWAAAGICDFDEVTVKFE